MPTYEYECNTCGHTVDVFHRMTEKPRVKCPECGNSTKKKIGAGAGIIFKGSGFYETDYKRKSVPKETRKEGEAAQTKAAESKKEEKKSEKLKGD
ncbi:MAG: zinc ribbon domain-containing protein [Candidatus Lindowbacteria bacterium]|nr:zinc ribbon domain-containing protein [Candidatus Lindowbacteria bacterium]